MYLMKAEVRMMPTTYLQLKRVAKSIPSSRQLTLDHSSIAHTAARMMGYAESYMSTQRLENSQPSKHLQCLERVQIPWDFGKVYDYIRVSTSTICRVLSYKLCFPVDEVGPLHHNPKCKIWRTIAGSARTLTGID